MKLKLPEYTQAVRKGSQVYYYYRRGEFRARLPGKPFSSEFMDAHAAAEATYLSGREAPSSVGADRLKPGSFNALVMAYYRSPEFVNLKPISQQTNRNVMERIRLRLGDAQVASFMSRHLEAMMAEKAGTPDAANRIRRMMKILIRHAVKMGLRSDDPTANIPKLKTRSEGYKTWGEDEIARFYEAHGEGTRARLAFDLMLYTGQRRSDIVRMGRQHVRNGVIAIRQSKGGALVEIPLHPHLKAAIEALPNENLTFLVTDQGKPFTAAGFGNWIGDCVRKAGLREGFGKGEKGLSSHGLRKAICRRLADSGCDALQIMAITGHRDIKQIMVYIEARDRSRAAEAAMKTIAGYGRRE